MRLGDTPVPIPNTTVKTQTVDGTFSDLTKSFVFGFEGAEMYNIFGDDAFGGHTRSHTEHDG